MATSLEPVDQAPSEHSRETVDSALIALIYSNGNCAQAARSLKEHNNTELDRTTIWKWRRKYEDRYLELRRQLEPKITETLAAEHEDAALLALSKTRDTLSLIDPGDIKPADRGKLAQQLAVAGGIHTDKASALRGRPTEVHEHRHAGEILQKLRTVAPSLIVNGSAEEDPPAVVTDSPPQRA